MPGRTSSRWIAFGGLIVAVLAVGLDVTVLSVALPTLAKELDASESQLQWFSSGYALVLAAAMLPAGLLGDRFGQKRVMLGALVLFGLGSIACAYAPSADVFIAARLGLGLAGAALIVLPLSVITVLFSEEERPRAVGIWAAANFLSFPIGPILGGWMLTNAWWGWVFLLNVPVALIGVVAVVALIPGSRAVKRPGIDVPGVLTSSGGLAMVTYGLIEAGRNGWDDETAVVPMALGLVVLVAFFVWEAWLSRRPGGEPLVDLGLFRSPAFSWGVILSAAGLMALVGILFTMPQYFQAILGTDAQGSGFRLLPVIGGLVFGALPADRLASRIGPRLTVAGGFGVAAAAMVIGATTTMESGDGFMAAWTFCSGLGIGLALSTAASSAVAQLPAEQSGVGAAVLQALQKLGAPFGSAVLGSVLSTTYRHQVDVSGLPGEAAALARESVFAGLAVAQQSGLSSLAESARTSFVSGVDDALLVSTGIALVAVVLAIVFLPARVRAATGQAAQTGAVPAGGGR